MTISTISLPTDALSIIRSGRLTPTDALELDDVLEPRSASVRPRILVDVSGAEEIHPAVVSVLRRHQRRARRQGGELQVIAPAATEARHTFDMVGLCSVRTAGGAPVG